MTVNNFLLTAIFVASATTAEAQVAQNCVYVLDPTASRAFMISGSRTVNTGCSIAVSSTAADALRLEGNARINLQNNARVGVVGGSQIVGQSAIWNTTTNQATSPVTITAAADPYASVAAPTSGTIIRTTPTSYDMNNRPANNTLSPGVYCGGLQIQNTGGVTFTMSPGVYVVAGGGFTANSGSFGKSVGNWRAHC